MTSIVGRFCYRRRWLVVIVWLVAMAGGGYAAGSVFERISDTNQLAGMESGRAYELLDEAQDPGGSVIGLWEGIDPGAPAVAEQISRARAELAAIPGVDKVEDPVIASDSRGVAIIVAIDSLADTDRSVQKQAVQAASARLKQLSAPGSTVHLGGSWIMDDQIDTAVQEDLNRAEFSSLPVTMLIMVFVFGGLIAAGIPLIATLATVAGAFGVLLGFSHFIDLDADIISVVSMLGLALCIDYSLLLVARYREEIAAGHAPPAALDRTWATAGRTISVSALTVTAALSGLLLLDVPRLSAMGAAGISATVVALLSALTLTAALLRVFGRWVKPSRRAMRKLRRAAGPATAPPAGSPGAVSSGDIPSGSGPAGTGSAEAGSAGAGSAGAGSAGSAPAGAGLADAGERGFFARLARLTQRRPLLFAAGTAGVLLAMGAPLLTATVKLPDLDAVPRSIESVWVYDELTSRYGRSLDPAIMVVAKTTPSTLDTWAKRWASEGKPGAAEEITPGLSVISFTVAGDSQSAAARDLVGKMRADRPVGVESYVTGDAAILVDVQAKIAHGLPYAIGVIVLAMFVLLFLMTGSVVIPLKALLMNFVSLGATFGVLVAVFEHGWLAGPLDTITVGGLSPFVIMLVFAFGFGLSMDYEVFLLARIKEHVDAGADTNLAVRRGLQQSGRIITSAALLMLIVFGFFAAANLGDIEQIGLGLFVAVLVDATIVRCLLVPATMTLLGKWNWWAPPPLRRIHARFGLRE